ncbi:MAG: rhamnulokinase [Muribaculaceae bacterium]|nr:rhamnulokinase [Muribaculaceae bacterium]
MSKTYIAADFGGGSGRIIAGSLADGRLTLRQIHRFDNRQVWLGKHLHWDFPMLYDEMLIGLRKAAAEYSDIVSIGIDTWGVDFGLVDSCGNLLGNPVCYRDPATEPMLERFTATTDMDAHYSVAGLQTIAINSMYRLMAMKDEGDRRLDIAEHLLFTPDLFSFFLTGDYSNEYTIASTSELLDARKHTWNYQLIESLGLPAHIFGPIIMPGQSRGTLLPDVALRTGMAPNVKVVAVGSHDTASAVHAIPGSYTADGTAFLSSGTWSLLGVELDSPITSPEARQAGFSNEGGTCSRIHFLQNITGLWILQQLVDGWKQRGLTSSYPELVQMAREASTDTLIDVDHPSFSRPGNMEEAIVRYCRERSLTPPSGQGEMVLCVLRSLADRYRRGIEELNKLLPAPVKRLHIIGGGSKNELLNSLTAEATGFEVTAGPAEATAIGNIIMQAQADGAISSPSDITEIIEP